ncbi:hypothetical protein EHQ81_13500 [Leptospira selangorensis]|uniref:Uncharacterized protein n=1 Tax=Leptospira selangorensis TaxID=2484982 RepID=A0A5F2C771_9LEPT|nr:hypothetical protein [Leptospira selangorensis]TGM12892.1 hypothetical protein EHQ81_13500 [Leptospira selangorensis]TGM30954.1 hypothetical protein EHQ82_01340 [Leptospira selangorensis]
MIYNREDFDSVWRLVNNAFFLSRRLPEMVFRKLFLYYTFLEFDVAFAKRGWSEMQKLSSENTENIILAVIEPDPVEYFRKEFGCYNIIKLSKNSSYKEYFSELVEEPQGSPADSIDTNSFIITLIPDSLEWAIWGDRECEILIIGSDKPLINFNSELFYLNIDEAIELMKDLNYKELDSMFFAEFRKNYNGM